MTNISILNKFNLTSSNLVEQYVMNKTTHFRILNRIGNSYKINSNVKVANSYWSTVKHPNGNLHIAQNRIPLRESCQPPPAKCHVRPPCAQSAYDARATKPVETNDVGRYRGHCQSCCHCRGRRSPLSRSRWPLQCWQVRPMHQVATIRDLRTRWCFVFFYQHEQVVEKRLPML